MQGRVPIQDRLPEDDRENNRSFVPIFSARTMRFPVPNTHLMPRRNVCKEFVKDSKVLLYNPYTTMSFSYLQ
jgi:hypothetical protein